MATTLESPGLVSCPVHLFVLVIVESSIICRSPHAESAIDLGKKPPDNERRKAHIVMMYIKVTKKWLSKEELTFNILAMK